MVSMRHPLLPIALSSTMVSSAVRSEDPLRDELSYRNKNTLVEITTIPMLESVEYLPD